MEVFTFGYGGKKMIEIKKDQIIIDVRLSPWSSDPKWRKEELEKRFGERYLHIPELGNVKYKERGKILLKNPLVGIKKIMGIRAGGIIVMCGCPNPEHCHRTLIGKILKNKGLDFQGEI